MAPEKVDPDPEEQSPEPWDKDLPNAISETRKLVENDLGLSLDRIRYCEMYYPVIFQTTKGEPYTRVYPYIVQREFAHGKIPIEIMTIKQKGIVMRIGKEGLEKCSDMGGILVDAQTKRVKGFAVADGVGSTLAANSTAYNAVDAAISRMQSITGSPDEEKMVGLILEVERMLKQSLDGRKFWEDIEENFAEEVLDVVREQIEERPGYIGATTLMSGLIEDWVLHVAQLGDGGYFVVNKDGVKMIGGYFDEKTPPGQMTSNPIGKLRRDLISHNSVQVKEGDLVFGFSDGLLRGLHRSVDALARRVIELLNDGISFQEIVGILVNEASNPIMGYWDDDVILEAFEV